jgi:hypothetical protein
MLVGASIEELLQYVMLFNYDPFVFEDKQKTCESLEKVHNI